MIGGPRSLTCAYRANLGTFKGRHLRVGRAGSCRKRLPAVSRLGGGPPALLRGACGPTSDPRSSASGAGE
eukprot:15185283-Alexandrium_andersonii.AAC.1